MVRQSTQETIAYLSRVNSASGNIDLYALGDEAEANRTSRIDERFAAIQLALISNLIETARAANDHLSVGLEVNRLMWFYGTGLSADSEFWTQKYRESGAAISFSFDCATVGINLANEMIHKQIEGVQECQDEGLKSEWAKALLGCIDKLNTEQGRLAPAVQLYQNVHDRAEKRMANYEDFQRPILDGFDVKGYFEALHREEVPKTAQAAAIASINVAKTFLVRASFIEQTVIASQPDNERALRQNVRKMHDNINGALDRATIWLDIQKIGEGFSWPHAPSSP